MRSEHGSRLESAERVEFKDSEVVDLRESAL